MTITSFSQLSLHPRVSSAVERVGFETPTAVQAEAIPAALEGRDVLASAQTGSGKTAAFVLPIIHHLANGRGGRPEPRAPRALILAPTRELAGQIASVVGELADGTRITHTTIFGGVNKRRQIDTLARGVDIAIATPGRLLDLMSDRAVALDHVRFLVLDEADRMLDMGFIPDVRRILKTIPDDRQSLFFSATLPGPVAELAGEMLHNPVHVRVERVVEETPDIDQRVLFLSKEFKRDALRMLLERRRDTQSIVFTRTKHRAKDLAQHLNKHGITADDLQGNKSQNARERAMRNFHSRKIQVLVATDIASRGLDVEDIGQVINYELPNEPESYVHRIGRTARAGRSGAAFSLCDDTEVTYLQAIEKEISRVVDTDDGHDWHSASIAGRAADLRERAARHGGGSRPARAGGSPQSSGGGRGRGGSNGRRPGPGRAAASGGGRPRSGAPSGGDRRQRYASR